MVPVTVPVTVPLTVFEDIVELCMDIEFWL